MRCCYTWGMNTCEKCGKPVITRHANRPGRFCSRDCYNAAGRPQRKAAVKHRLTRAPEHPIAPPSGTVAVSRVVLYDKIGPGEQCCHWCGQSIHWTTGRAIDAIVADHLDHDPTNDSPDNLVPSCNGCNGHRRKAGDSKRIQEDEPVLLMNGRPTRAVVRYCNICGTEFLALPAAVAKGKSRYCSRSCARKAPRRPRT